MTFYISHWGTKWNAYDCVFLERQQGCLSFEFTTAWNCPDPIYRELGRMFPRLEFDIAAIDPGIWGVTIHIRGDSAVFNEDAGWRAVHARVYKEPFEDASQPAM